MTTTTEEYESLLVLGLCYFLHDVGIGWYAERAGADEYVENPTPATLPTILIAAMPPQPDRIFSVTYYAQREAAPGVPVHSLQVRIRTDSDPLSPVEYTGKMRRLLHRRSGVLLADGRIRPTLITMGGLADMGADPATPERREFALNFDFMGLPYVRPVS